MYPSGYDGGSSAGATTEAKLEYLDTLKMSAGFALYLAAQQESCAMGQQHNHGHHEPANDRASRASPSTAASPPCNWRWDWGSAGGLSTSHTALTSHLLIDPAQLARERLAALGIRKCTLQLEADPHPQP